MTPREVLVRIREILSDENKWWGGPNDRRQIPARDRECPITALLVVTGERNIPLEAAVMKTLDETAASFGGIAAYNDSHTHSEVLAMVDKAIAKCEQKEREEQQYERGYP